MPIVGVPSNSAVEQEKLRDEFVAKMRTQVSHVFDNPDEIWVEHGVINQPGWVFVSADGEAEPVTGTVPSRELFARLEVLAEGL